MRTGDESVSIASTKRDILNSLKDREYRAAFNLENVYTTICFQLRALREQRVMSQAAFGQQVKPKMAQERISILEDPNADSKPTLNTLLRLAEGLDVGLEVRFVPFSIVLERSTHTNMRELEVESFEDELPRLEQTIAAEATPFQPQPFALVAATPVMNDAAMEAFYRPTQPVSPTTCGLLTVGTQAGQNMDTSWITPQVLGVLIGNAALQNTLEWADLDHAVVGKRLPLVTTPTQPQPEYEWVPLWAGERGPQQPQFGQT
jgi:hypothetical protein